MVEDRTEEAISSILRVCILGRYIFLYGGIHGPHLFHETIATCVEIISGVKAENRASIGTDSIMRLVPLTLKTVRFQQGQVVLQEMPDHG
ncbi:hypothetical protein HZH68_002758 [Vespula germanica]|uniref:Uncharacterized protein n=3 Tax=Vespula TaxID=7451 RepID=A0A834U1P5_VESGE|nr:hypothetical protein HZH68_002758 [Vespula germanica]KAF7434667.1 hypothetical protein H0235_002858 [Vespula pensylvanica]